MMDPRDHQPFAGSSGSPGSSGDSLVHLDDLAVMLLADGEALPAAAAHAAACAFCAGRVAALRAEAAALAGALSLNDDELAFLQEAQVPARVVAWAAAPAFARPFAQRWESPGLLLGTLAVAGAGAAGWQVATSALAVGMETARWTGVTALLANLVAGWTLALIQVLWQATMTIGALPAIDAPALPLLVLAGILWLALGLAPRLAPRLAPARTEVA